MWSNKRISANPKTSAGKIKTYAGKKICNICNKKRKSWLLTLLPNSMSEQSWWSWWWRCIALTLPPGVNCFISENLGYVWSVNAHVCFHLITLKTARYTYCSNRYSTHAPSPESMRDVVILMSSVWQIACLLITSQTCAAKITRNLSAGGEQADISVCFDCFISGKSSVTHRVWT